MAATAEPAVAAARETAPFGLIAEFEQPEALARAVDAALDAGYTRLDAFGPFPMPHIAKALGTRPTIIPWIALLSGLVGGAIQYGMQVWTNAVDYPLNVGGRPLHSWPAFLPSTLIVTVLWTGAATLLGLLLILRLPRLHHPVFGVPGFERASEDRFFLLIQGDDPAFDRDAATRFLEALGPRAVREVPA